MAWMALLALSGLMIIAGVVLVARDWKSAPGSRRNTTRPAVAPPPPAEDAVAETPFAPEPPPPANLNTTVADTPGLAELKSTITGLTAEAAGVRHGEHGRDARLEARFAEVARSIDDAVNRVNSALAPVKARIGDLGEVGWSLDNAGFGGYRRIWIEGRSTAWLRTELDHDGRLQLRLRAHKDEQATLNASAFVGPTPLAAPAIADALAAVMKPTAQYAAWIVPRNQANLEAAERGWNEVASAVKEALALANAALAEAEAKLHPRGEAAWDVTAERHRLFVDVMVAAEAVAMLHIDRIGTSIEIAVGVPDPRRIELGRRAQIPVLGLAVLPLAEALASAAWPAIADAVGRSGKAQTRIRAAS
jgi:hypothetical protein